MAELTRGGFFAPPSNIGCARTPSKIGLNETTTYLSKPFHTSVLTKVCFKTFVTYNRKLLIIYLEHVCLCRYQFYRLPSPPRADCWATNFFRQNRHPRDSFSAQNSGPRVKKTKQKSPPPGTTCLVQMPRDQ